MMESHITWLRRSLSGTAYHFHPSLMYPNMAKVGLHSKYKLLALPSIIILGIRVEVKGTLLITTVKRSMKQGPVQFQDDRVSAHKALSLSRWQHISFPP